jgi:GxxExxY protein
MECEEEKIGKQVVDASIKIHRTLGPGLLESVYELVLFDELTRRGLNPKVQVPVPVLYEGRLFDAAFRADLVVNERVIIELKSIEALNRAHAKQVLTYLKLSGLRLGFLLNFGSHLMKDGIHRFVNLAQTTLAALRLRARPQSSENFLWNTKQSSGSRSTCS